LSLIFLSKIENWPIIYNDKAWLPNKKTTGVNILLYVIQKCLLSFDWGKAGAKNHLHYLIKLGHWLADTIHKFAIFCFANEDLCHYILLSIIQVKDITFDPLNLAIQMGDFQKNEDFVWHRGWNFKLDKLT